MNQFVKEWFLQQYWKVRAVEVVYKRVAILGCDAVSRRSEKTKQIQKIKQSNQTVSIPF